MIIIVARCPRASPIAGSARVAASHRTHAVIPLPRAARVESGWTASLSTHLGALVGNRLALRLHLTPCKLCGVQLLQVCYPVRKLGN